MSTLITFAANNEHFRKRKRVYRACESCKKRRKRCAHTFAGDNIDARSSPDLEREPVPEVTHARTESDGDQPPRFIGYLSPEAVFRGPAPEQERSQAQDQNQCGYWLPTEGDVQNQPKSQERRKLDAKPGTIRIPSHEAYAIERAREAYLHAIDVFLLPPRRHEDALVDLYFSSVHPILPILDAAVFGPLHRKGAAPKLLRQAICIVASKDIRARDHLYLSNEPALWRPRDFANRLYVSTVAALEAKLESDRIVLIQVLALLSLHSEGSDGAEQASMHLAQAIHHAHTFGLHFNRKRYHPRNESLEKLFWCLWGLDKLNGSLNGRPHFMHNRDNWMESVTTDTEARQSPFGVWLQLSEALDKITHLYRPGAHPSTTGWELGFPSFEDIIADGAEQMDSGILAVLELYYHAVAIISYRAKSINDPMQSTPSQIRQSLSAVRVVSILSREAPEDLPPLPIVPYAVSLAMTVAYRQFRQSKLPTHKKRAKGDLQTCCHLLNEMKIYWWSAEAMADLGHAALNKADAGAGLSDTSGTLLDEATQHTGDPTDGALTDSSSIEPAGATRQSTAPTSIATSSCEGGIELYLPHQATSDGNVNQTNVNYSEQAPLPEDPSLTGSMDWLNFDNAFENLDTLLGCSGPDLSDELLKPLYNDGPWAFGPPL